MNTSRPQSGREPHAGSQPSDWSLTASCTPPLPKAHCCTQKLCRATDRGHRAWCI